MKAEPVINNRFITPKTTGYAAIGGIILTAASGCSKTRFARRSHKHAAYFTAIMSALHIALVEYNNYKWKNKQKELKKQIIA